AETWLPEGYTFHILHRSLSAFPSVPKTLSFGIPPVPLPSFFSAVLFQQSPKTLRIFLHVLRSPFMFLHRDINRYRRINNQHTHVNRRQKKQQQPQIHGIHSVHEPVQFPQRPKTDHQKISYRRNEEIL